MKILVINCGSSSLKYQLIDMETENVLAKGLVERIGVEGSVLTQKTYKGDKYVVETPMNSHQIAIELVLNALTDEVHGVISNMDEIAGVGHRIVSGGAKYTKSALVDEAAMENIEECCKLAPLHNPAHIIGIKACQSLMPKTPMVVVFDTAFHQTMPEKAFMYALPYDTYEQNAVRRYGAHGTSHKFVSTIAAEMMGKDIKDVKMVTCHLGNGASMSAVDGGKCVDTSMGLTPLEGLIMGTRCGDIDPAIIPYLMKARNLTPEQMDTMMNKQSGVLGVSGVSSDFRDVEDAAKEGNHRAQLALDMFHYRVKKYIGAYAAAMNGLDCLVFTAGLGENSIGSREEICKDMEFFGIKLDKEKNNVRGKAVEVSAADSKVKIFVIPTNEELMIARDTLELVK
ncbi:acetate kinase [Hathewaya proteolytica DSM 3090]|uniref:Acetate kinase n=1 Tax=Hathewaya proteolytica DSM 3090 TaxID=1121331 RepID=A0A1M6J941_9CLOT|nr:acetate kinase [Hathewaya proteolytica]SHJ43160.1 acetate kinase [Hathewaya proteolytica DSM 3090]